MPEIRLPDGSSRHYDAPVSVQKIVEDIGPGLARAAVAAVVNGRAVDLSHLVQGDCDLRVLRAQDDEGLEVVRHSTAHLLAHAVKQLFPDAQVTIGPVIEDGFYYDFAFPAGFHESDLERIEKRMAELAARDIPVFREEMPRDAAVSYFRDLGEEYKAQIIASIPQGETISLYRQGDFVDLCRGPHVPSTGRLGAFKLTKLAGAYWRGDSSNEMLQRIYGTAWPDKKSLKAYLRRLEEAEKRDHRRLGRQLDLFHFQEEAPGMAFWHRDGWTLFNIVQNYMHRVTLEYGYQEVQTPQILDRTLWERSGHWDKFQENIFTTSVENRDYAIKPMNCPGHIQIFNQGLKSYRDLPIRISEFGVVHRNEPSGTLHGLFRVRRFTQDDAHVFCSEDQIGDEVATLIDLTYRVYNDFGFHEVDVALSTRPARRVGEDELWDRAENDLAEALKEKGIEYRLQPGEGAFYGPKIEFVLKDSIGRRWQCGTIQLDFFMPGRLGSKFIDEHGEKQVPVMIHRAILGSIERFIGILIEDTEGKLPVWLSPRQAVLMTITDAQADWVREAQQMLEKQGVRVFSDLRNEKIGYKIREHTLQRVPFLLVVGDKEVANRSVAVRTREGQDLGAMTIEQFGALVASGNA
ncbi:MAG: threonine--tRNA ligase [Proteobacteria bacterium]|nr:MAG: threonine--tRNA ligase [Pseudomonadota bacterium]